MTAKTSSPSNLQPNPNWANLLLFDRKGWKRLAFGDFAESIGARVEPKDTPEEIYVGLEHVDPQCLHIRRWGKGRDVTGTKLQFRKGDIIFGRRRAYQRKLAVAEMDGICSAHAMVVRARAECVLPEFLPFLMMSDRFMNRAVEISVGSLSPTINWRTLKLEEFDLPPLDQQRRIAEILWTVDEAGMASEALQNATSETLRAKVNGAFFDGQDQAQFTADWPIKRLEEVVNLDAPIRYGIVQVLANVKDGVPTLAINSLSGDFVNGIHRTAPKIEANYSGSRVVENDVLIAVKGATAGKIGIVPKHFEGNISRDLARIRCGSSMNPRLLLYLMRSERYQAYISKYAVGSTRKEISIHNLRRFEVPVPPQRVAMRLGEEFDQLQSASSSANGECKALAALLRSLINQVV